MAATVVRPPITSTHSGRAPAIMLGLAMLVGLVFVAGFAFPYFAGGDRKPAGTAERGELVLLGGAAARDRSDFAGPEDLREMIASDV